VVSGDPDGLYETIDRLDKVRDDIGTGEIRIFVPERPLAKETWYEIDQATEGCKLLILDNLTQFVPGSLSDDFAVKKVYEQLEFLSRRGDDMAVCVLAHTSDKKNEWGHSSNIPSGSFVIRSVPRWFVYMRRASGVLTLNMSGNSGGRPWRMELSEPTDTPRFDTLAVIEADELDRLAGKRNRTKGKLDRWAEYQAYALANPGMTQKAVADHFGVSAATINHAVNATLGTARLRLAFTPIGR
jgi:hypothetical protein